MSRAPKKKKRVVKAWSMIGPNGKFMALKNTRAMVFFEKKRDALLVGFKTGWVPVEIHYTTPQSLKNRQAGA